LKYKGCDIRHSHTGRIQVSVEFPKLLTAFLTEIVYFLFRLCSQCYAAHSPLPNKKKLKINETRRNKQTNKQTNDQTKTLEKWMFRERRIF